jgi:hypothetical protein
LNISFIMQIMVNICKMYLKKTSIQ